MSVLAPHLEVLPAAQRLLWPELRAVPRTFVLYGGTALALRLGHRSSIDFDFFQHDPLDTRRLRAAASFLSGAEVLDEGLDSLTVSIDRNDPVKLSFYGAIAFGRVGEPSETSDGILRVASLLDLAATKLKVLLQRVEAKDYLDVAALLGAGVPLVEGLAAARALFGSAFNPLIARKALAFFEGGDLDRLPAETRALLVAEAIQDLELPEMPRRAARLD